jgi:hypothetical protein
MGSLMKVLANASALVISFSLILAGQASEPGASATGASTNDRDVPAALVTPTQTSASSQPNQSNSSTTSAPVLKAVAEFASLPATATVINSCPLKRYRGKKLNFVSLHIKNTSDQVAIIDGDNSQAEVPAEAIRATNAAVLIKGNSQNLTPEGKVLVAAVTAASLGLAGIIYVEYMTPDQNRQRDLGHSIGLDGVRHDVEKERFGRRLLMPGDETTGWLAFECDDDEAIKSLKVPMCFSPMRSPPSYIDVPVHAGASL